MSLSSARRGLTAALAPAVRSGASVARHASTSAALPASAPRLPPSGAAASGGSSLPPSRLKPLSPAHYTARPTYIDALLTLEDLTRRSKRALEGAHALAANAPPPPAPRRARGSNLWGSPAALSQSLGLPLKTAQYRQLITRLSLLDRYSSLVRSHLASGAAGAANAELAVSVEETLSKFARDERKGEAVEEERESKVDEQGRAYSRGRRKDASARVWVIPTKIESTAIDATSDVISSAGEVLINAQPLSSYFSRVDLREQVLWPLRLTGTLGAFNVFGLTRGGGNSGQAGAIAHGLANALIGWFENQARETGDEERLMAVRAVLYKDGVAKRDPRMVERKKPGMAKARKAYTWVKR